MSNEGNPVPMVTYEITYSSRPVTANEIHVQSVTRNHKIVSKYERDVPLDFFDGIVANGKSPYFENGILKQGITINGACESSAPYIEDILADEELGIHQTVRVDPYSPQPAYNPWYKPFAKRAQRRQEPTTVDEVSNFIATYQSRPHNSWNHGQCLGTIIAIVIFVAFFVYMVMRLGGHFKG